MARKIRFPLVMKNGVEVRTIEELRENFDIEAVLKYYFDGKLKQWLENRYFYDKVEALDLLDEKDSNLPSEICKILEVDRLQNSEMIDISRIRRASNKIDILRKHTDNQDIIDNLDMVAIDQEDLNEILLEKGVNKQVYLLGEKFYISPDASADFIGINSPTVVLDKLCYKYKESSITFRGVEYEMESGIRISYGEFYIYKGKMRKQYLFLSKKQSKGIRDLYIL